MRVRLIELVGKFHRREFAPCANARLTRLEIRSLLRSGAQPAPRPVRRRVPRATDRETRRRPCPAPTAASPASSPRPCSSDAHRHLLEIGVVEPELAPVRDDRSARTARGSPSGNDPGADDRERAAGAIGDRRSCRSRDNLHELRRISWSCRRRRGSSSTRGHGIVRRDGRDGASVRHTDAPAHAWRYPGAQERRRDFTRRRAAAARGLRAQPLDCSGPDEPGRLHRLDHARGAVVADLEPTLHAGDRGLAALGHDAHGLVVQRVLLRVAAFARRAVARSPAAGDRRRRPVEDLVDVDWRARARAATLHDAVHFLVGHEGAVHAHGTRGAGRQEQHVAVAEQRSAPLWSRIVRESTFAETWNAMRVGKFALMRPVMTSTDGRCVARIRWMPAARAFCARRVIGSSTFLPTVIIRSASSSTMTTMRGSVLEQRRGLRIAAAARSRFISIGSSDRPAAPRCRLLHLAVVAVEVAHARRRPGAGSAAPSPPRTSAARSPPASCRSRPARAGAECPRRPRARASSGRS